MSESRFRETSVTGNVYCADLFSPPKRRRSRSLCSTTSLPAWNSSSCPFPGSPPPPPSAYDLDRLNYHITLQTFSDELQNAANAIFPSDSSNLSRYSEVDVILLSWEEEDPNLPVSIEVKELSKTFEESYGFNVQEWLIPEDNCHNRLQLRILQFLGENDPAHLKIVYYAGHGKLTNHGQPAWTSFQNSRKERCPTVKWSGIQNTLEESQSDVLILLDCCSSGVATTDEGNGVTELIAACAYNAIANGVGRFSFTHALNTKLRQMAQLPSFTVGFLYNAIFTEIQGWIFDDPRHRKIPVHLVLSQNHDRSIRLSNFAKRKETQRAKFEKQSSPPIDDGNSHLQHFRISSTSETPEQLPIGSASPSSLFPSVHSSETSLSSLPEYPRLLFSIRLSEDVKPNDLSVELFADWLRSVPASAKFIKIEAGFASNSTLLILSIPPAVLGFLPLNPAITLLGTIHSENIVVRPVVTPNDGQQPVTEAVDQPHLPIPALGPTLISPRSWIEDRQWGILENPSEELQPYDHIPPFTGEFTNRSDLTNLDTQIFDKSDPSKPQNLIVPGATRENAEWYTSIDNASPHLPAPDGALPPSPGHSASSAASSFGVKEDDDITSVYSLPIDAENQVVLAKMRPAHLSLSGPMFREDVPEDIGYEIYKLATLVQALNPQSEKLDSRYWLPDG